MGNSFKIWSLKACLCFGLVALMGCSDSLSDNETPLPDAPSASDPSFFAIKIYDSSSVGSATRADRIDTDNPDFGTSDYIFNKGLADEKAIYYENDNNMMPTSRHFAIFFDNDGKRTRNILLRSKVTDKNDETLEGNVDGWDAYTVLYSGPVEDDLLVRNDKGTMLVILNASDKLIETFESLWTLGEYKELLLSGDNIDNYLYFTKDDKKYFTMSSSMVINGNEVMPANVGRLAFYSSEEDARTHETEYQMFVERLQVKYTVLFKSQTENQYYYFDPAEASKDTKSLEYHPSEQIIFTSGTDFTPREEGLRYVSSYERSESIDKLKDVEISTGQWKVNFTGWSLNALETQEYLFKKLNKEATDDIYFRGWQTAPTIRWNNEDYQYRNFWAEDPTYTGGIYPDQYRDDSDEYESSESKVDEWTSNSSLKYLSYKDLAQKEIHQYSPESTFDESLITGITGKDESRKYEDYEAAVEDLAHLRAGTHVIITAQLLIEGFDDDSYDSTSVDEYGLITGVKHKYFMNGIYWSEEAYKEYVAEYLAYWMLTEENQKIDKFGKNDGKFYKDQNGTVAGANDFQIVPANIKGGDGMVWMKPANNNNNKVTLYKKDPSKDGTEAYSIISDEQYNALAKDHKEYWAKHYNEGRMYYAVPVRHNITNITNTLKGTGDFGSVRNHWYYFTVNQILTPGAPVDKPEQPIIPNHEPKENGLGVNIKILEWNRIGTSVDVSDQQPKGNEPGNQ